MNDNELEQLKESVHAIKWFLNYKFPELDETCVESWWVRRVEEQKRQRMVEKAKALLEQNGFKVEKE